MWNINQGGSFGCCGRGLICQKEAIATLGIGVCNKKPIDAAKHPNRTSTTTKTARQPITFASLLCQKVAAQRSPEGTRSRRPMLGKPSLRRLSHDGTAGPPLTQIKRAKLCRDDPTALATMFLPALEGKVD